MALTRDQKQECIAGLTAMANDAVSMVCVDYQGITSEQMSSLRKRARTDQVGVVVLRNNLAKRAFSDTKFAPLSDTLAGPILAVYSQEDMGASARFVKDIKSSLFDLQVRSISLGSDEVLGADSLKRVASLPTYEESMAKLLLILKSPATAFVSTLEAVPTKLLRTLKAVAEKKS